MCDFRNSDPLASISFSLGIRRDSTIISMTNYNLREFGIGEQIAGSMAQIPREEISNSETQTPSVIIARSRREIKTLAFTYCAFSATKRVILEQE